MKLELLLRPARLSGTVALSLLVAGSCLAPVGARASDLPDHASPSICVVLTGLALQRDLIDEEDKSDYEDAQKAYRKMSEEINGDKTVADQMIASNVNPLSQLSDEEVSKGAEMCLDSVDDHFTEDE